MQFLASLYAIFILPPLLTSSTLELLWLEIVALGTNIAEIGALLTAIGIVVGLLGRGWLGLIAGLGVLLLGAITWLFPYLHLKLRVSRMLRKFSPEAFVKTEKQKLEEVIACAISVVYSEEYDVLTSLRCARPEPTATLSESIWQTRFCKSRVKRKS